ncbi:MAG: DUF4091 domain-containing protein [Verrucomicrobia bacterium]|nr:DUF4091 domain-containing protein [Verrucomicrobiota bacterium]
MSRLRSAWTVPILLPALLASPFPAWTAEVVPAPRDAVMVASTKEPPVLDGSLDDPCWKAAVPVGDFLDPRTGGRAGDPTRLFFCATDRHFYIAVEASSREGADFIAEERENEGPRFFEGSTVEIFLDPTGDGRRYFHFGVNPLNARYDADGNNALWNGEWRAQAKAERGRWTVEIEIPFATLVPEGRMSPRWRFNVARTDRFASGNSALHSFQDLGRPNFHQPARFGPLVFASVAFIEAIRPPERISKPLIALTDEFTLWLADDWTKPVKSQLVRRDPSALIPSVSLLSARNEWSVFQIVLLPETDAEGTISFDLGNGLKAARCKGRISRDHFSWRHAAEVNDLYPDILVPCASFKTRGRFNHTAWFSLYAPANTAAGEYTGKIRILNDKKEIGAVELNLRVWDFCLPDHPALFTTFFDFAPPLRQGTSPQSLSPCSWLDLPAKAWAPLQNGKEGWAPLGPEVDRFYERLRETYLRYRVSPMNVTPLRTRERTFACEDKLVSSEITDEFARWAGWWSQRGYPVGDIAYYMETDIEKIEPYYRHWREFLRKRSWLDKAYVNTPIDEPDDQNPDSEEKVIRWAQELRRIAPDLRLQINPVCSNVDPSSKPGAGRWRASKGLKAYEGLADLWLQLPQQFADPRNLEFFRKQQARGCKLGWYLQNDLLVSQPAIQHRNFFWRMMRYHVDFFIVYRMNEWTLIERREPGERFFWRSGGYGPGMGVLLWPGSDNKLFDSLRLEIMRDGIEDHEYWTLLIRWRERLRQDASPAAQADAAEIDRLLALGQRLVQSPTQASHHPADYQAVRQQWGELIEQLARKHRK